MRVASAFTALALLGIECAQAQGWAPQENVELVVPVAPGGTSPPIEVMMRTHQIALDAEEHVGLPPRDCSTQLTVSASLCTY